MTGAARGWTVSLGVRSPRALGIDGGVVWVAGRTTLWACGLDAVSGAECRRVALPEPAGYDGGALGSGVLVLRGRDAMRGIDLARGEVAWSRPADPDERLIGMVGDRVVVHRTVGSSKPADACAEVELLAARSGDRAACLRLEELRVASVRLTGTTLIASSGGRVVAIDVERGRTMWGRTVPADALGDSLHHPIVFGGRVWLVADVERRSGPHLRLTPLRLADGGEEPAIDLAGSLRFPAAAGDFGIVIGTRDEVPVAIAWQADGATAVVETASEGYPASEPGLAASTGDGELAIARRGPDGRLGWTRIPVPGGTPPIPECSGGRVLLACDDDLLSIDAATAPFAPVVDLELTARPVAEPPGAGPEAEVVMTSGSGLVVVEHAELGRVRFVRSPDHPPLAKGDRVVLVEVTVRPGGGVDVHRWRKPGGSREPVGQATTRLLSSVELPAPAEPTPAEPLAPILAEVERESGAVPPLLRRLVNACDGDAIVRRRWDSLGLRLEVGDLEELAELDDAGVLERLGFAPILADDYKALGFINGPAGPSGGRPFAAWSTEDLELAWVGADFDDWFRHWLGDKRDVSRSVVEYLLQDLGLAADWPIDESPYRPPPNWFTAQTEK